MNGILLPGDSRWLSAASPSKLGPGALILAGSVASLYAHRQRRRYHLPRKFYSKAIVSPYQGGIVGTRKRGRRKRHTRGQLAQPWR